MRMTLGDCPGLRILWLALALALGIPAMRTQDASATANATALAEQTAAALAQQTATAIAAIEPVEHNILHRPIELSDGSKHWIDRVYAYGGTLLNTRPVHLGVEFVNERNTAVYAAKAGRVVFAGEDSHTQLGPRLDYYGKVVVLAHDIRTLAGRRLFTLYGHLEKIEVRAGQSVDDQARLGRVGSTGVALGPHLHFEVRVGDPFDYRQTRNPELWLQHYLEHGMVVGSVRDQDGELITGWRLTARSDSERRDVFTYGGDEVNSDPVWRENFVIGDLIAGSYEILALDKSGALAYREMVKVEAYRTTYVDIVLAD